MKLIRIFIVVAVIIASLQFAEASPVLTSPTENFQMRRPPPPPNPLHLFGRHPRRRRVVRHRRTRHITLPHIKLPPPPPAPPRP